MRFPIKLNRNAIPSWFCSCLPCKGDPRRLVLPETCGDSFECSISAIKIGETWKTTQKKRHILSDQLIVEASSSLSKPNILEIGASSGSTSMELLDGLKDNYGLYYVTDLYFNLRYVTKNGCTYLYHPLTGDCIMLVTDNFLIYEDVAGALFPLGLIADRIIKRAPRLDLTDAATMGLLHPRLIERVSGDSRLIVMEYNVLEPWNHELLDIVKVANVLNRIYFSDVDILKALTNLKNVMKTNGRLVITDNRSIEMASVFYKSEEGKFILESEINGGSAITEMIKAC